MELSAEQHRAEAIEVVEVVADCGAANFSLENLTERRGQVLRVERGDAAGGLRAIVATYRIGSP